MPAKDLVPLLTELRAKLVRDGIMLHVIDHSDHLEFGDKSISRVHFLTWTAEKHAIMNRLMKDGENRLRFHEYSPLFQSAGLKLLDAWADIHQPTLRTVRSLALKHPYCEMESEQIATLTSYVLLTGND